MRLVIVALPIVLASLMSACATTSTTTTTSTSAAPAKSAKKYWTCPVCGMEFKGDGHVGYYGVYPVHFCSRVDAEQFTALPPDKRATLAAPQVLSQKKITNSTCPLTGETLTAAAAPVKYEGEIIGFASTADANQFMSLTKAKQQSTIDRWRQSTSQTA